MIFLQLTYNGIPIVISAPNIRISGGVISAATPIDETCLHVSGSSTLNMNNNICIQSGIALHVNTPPAGGFLLMSTQNVADSAADTVRPSSVYIIDASANFLLSAPMTFNCGGVVMTTNADTRMSDVLEARELLMILTSYASSAQSSLGDTFNRYDFVYPSFQEISTQNVHDALFKPEIKAALSQYDLAFVLEAYLATYHERVGIAHDVTKGEIVVADVWEVIFSFLTYKDVQNADPVTTAETDLVGVGETGIEDVL